MYWIFSRNSSVKKCITMTLIHSIRTVSKNVLYTLSRVLYTLSVLFEVQQLEKLDMRQARGERSRVPKRHTFGVTRNTQRLRTLWHCSQYVEQYYCRSAPFPCFPFPYPRPHCSAGLLGITPSLAGGLRLAGAFVLSYNCT